MLKNTLLKFCFIFLCFYQFSFCLDISSEKEKKYIIYQTELDQLKNNLNNIEKEKNEALKSLEIQTENYKKLQLELNNSEKILKQSDLKILNLEINYKNIQALLETQKNKQLKLEQDLITNQSQLILAEQSFKEYKKEATSKINKKEFEKYIFFLGGIGAGILIDKLK